MRTEIDLMHIRYTPFLLQNNPPVRPPTQPQSQPQAQSTDASQPQLQCDDGAQVDQAQSGEQEVPERILQPLPPSPDTSEDVVGVANDNTSDNAVIGAQPDTVHAEESGKIASGESREEHDGKASEELQRDIERSADRVEGTETAERDDRRGSGEPELAESVREEAKWRERAGEAAHDAVSIRWPC